MSTQSQGSGEPTAPAPELTLLSPATVAAGAHATVVTLNGSGFVDRSAVEVNGAVVASTLLDATHLQIVLGDAQLASGAVLHISVATSTPGGGVSASLPFDITNPSPTLSSLSPLGSSAGGGDVQLTVQGGQFATAATVDFDGSALQTVYFSSGQLAARIPSGLLVAAGTHDITVVNPDPGGGTSTKLVFTVSDNAASLTALAPSSTSAGSPDVAITLTGTGIEQGSAATFNGTSLTTTRVDDTHLAATIPAALLVTSGDFPVSIVGPFAGDSPSVPLVFHVYFGAPTLASSDPAVLPQGAGDTTLTLKGDGFLPTITATLDGQPAATATFIDRETMSVVVPAALLVAQHDLQVTVTTPAPGGGTSSALAVPVRGVSPDLVSISPNSVFAGASDTTVTFGGTSFLPSSIARMDGTALTTTYGGPSSLSAVVPASFLVNPGTHQVAIDNGSAGGSSAGVPFSVGCDTSGVDVVLSAAGTPQTLSVTWSAQPTLPPITDTGEGACPSSPGGGGDQPYVGWVVQNDTTSTRSLEAWAVCGTSNTGRSDAFLTFYARSSVPTDASASLACTGVIAEGADGYEGLTSPEANGSKYCPGLTVADGASLSLAACGRAVVFMQPWDVTSSSYPPPTTLRVDLQ